MAATDRRSFLLSLGSAPLLGPGVLPQDPADDLAALNRLVGLEFTAEERRQAATRLQRHRDAYTALRAAAVPFELPPCAAFDPVQPGSVRPAPTVRVAVAIPRDVPLPNSDTDLAFLSVLELASLLRQGLVSSVQLTRLYLDRLERFDGDLHAVVTLLRDEALATAAARDAELAAGKDRGPLHGIPYGAKDLFAWPSAPTTFGAAPFREHRWAMTATVLQKLSEAGAVLVAKLSLGALAMGDLWYGGRTRNPYQPARGSSGSSAGSASAVAAGLVPFALGTETLGSIVSPCRQCGVGGLRPTFGTVSRHGAMPLSWTMDKVGPIARRAVDLALVFDTIRGADGRDPAAVDAAFPWRLGAEPRGLRVGIVTDGSSAWRQEDRALVDWLVAQGHTTVPFAWPAAPYEAMLLMLQAEAATAFDDFVRQGLAKDLPGQGEGDWPNQFRSARSIPAVEYLRASRLRTRLCVDVANAMHGIDLLVAPTHGGSTLAATNLTGHPTLVLPVGRSERDGGRPTVLALVGQLYGEAALLSVAEAWQQATDHHRARPALTS